MVEIVEKVKKQNQYFRKREGERERMKQRERE